MLAHAHGSKCRFRPLCAILPQRWPSIALNPTRSEANPKNALDLNFNVEFRRTDVCTAYGCVVGPRDARLKITHDCAENWLEFGSRLRL